MRHVLTTPYGGHKPGVATEVRVYIRWHVRGPDGISTPLIRQIPRVRGPARSAHALLRMPVEFPKPLQPISLFSVT
jgi:hypothetical protein